MRSRSTRSRRSNWRRDAPGWPRPTRCWPGCRASNSTPTAQRASCTDSGCARRRCAGRRRDPRARLRSAAAARRGRTATTARWCRSGWSPAIRSNPPTPPRAEPAAAATTTAPPSTKHPEADRPHEPRHPQHRHHRPRRPRQDHAGRPAAAPVGHLPRQPAGGRAGDGLQRPRARARHHHPRQELRGRVRRHAHQHRRHAGPRRLRRRGRARAVDGRRRAAAGRRGRGADAADALRHPQGARARPEADRGRQQDRPARARAPTGW